MIKLSKLISIPVINIFDLKQEGVIENVLVDFKTKKAKFLVVYNEENDTYKTIAFKDVYTFGDDAVMIANASKITLYENTELQLKNLVSPLNTICYNLEGTKIGKTTEINLQKDFLHSIEIGENSYPISQVKALNNSIGIVSNSNINITRFKVKSNFKTTKNNIKVSISATTPAREIANYNFLLSRKLTKDITNENGEVLARSGSRITIATINKLKYYGKLKELTLNSK